MPARFPPAPLLPRRVEESWGGVAGELGESWKPAWGAQIGGRGAMRPSLSLSAAPLPDGFAPPLRAAAASPHDVASR